MRVAKQRQQGIGVHQTDKAEGQPGTAVFRQSRLHAIAWFGIDWLSFSNIASGAFQGFSRGAAASCIRMGEAVGTVSGTSGCLMASPWAI
jgi:hypothetical protein